MVQFLVHMFSGELCIDVEDSSGEVGQKVIAVRLTFGAALQSRDSGVRPGRNFIMSHNQIEYHNHRKRVLMCK